MGRVSLFFNAFNVSTVNLKKEMERNEDFLWKDLLEEHFSHIIRHVVDWMINCSESYVLEREENRNMSQDEPTITLNWTPPVRRSLSLSSAISKLF